ncbi:MAG: RNA polymerase sigma factor, partial [Planctomycetota bacterium]
MPDPVPIEDLLAHRDFLHRLAAGIVRNDATADDLVQDTWLDALHRPPRSRLNLRQWLAVIVTRKAYRERVRALREAAAPWDRAEVTAESAGECAAHGSLSERIAGSVLACREPYRSVLLLRFYEGLPPREIAARTALSIHTVNSRLQRALALVRADLSAGEEGPPERLPLLLLAAAPRRDGPQAHPAAATRGRPVARPRSAWRLA